MQDKYFSPDSARFRAQVLENIRSFFKKRGVLEIDTPILSRGVSTDCHLDVFSTSFHPDGCRESQNSTHLYLQTSPELLMKRLLSKGFPDIFQICKVFRNGEYGKIHNPEFTMLEWYRHDFSMFEIMEETADLCKMILGAVKKKLIRYEDVFFESTGLNPIDSSYERLYTFCNERDRTSFPCETKSDLLNYMMSEFVEPVMEKDTLVFVHNFPAQQAVLAKLDPCDRRTALRFELYSGGMEICNGYEELCDSDEVKSRMEEDNRRRQKMNKPQLPVDRRFLESVASLPGCSGAALGIDRLVLTASGKKSVDSTIPFTFETC